MKHPHRVVVVHDTYADDGPRLNGFCLSCGWSLDEAEVESPSDVHMAHDLWLNGEGAL